MDQNKTALERAFELARSGQCSSVADIRRQLDWEGYSASQVSGRTLSKQLLALVDEAKSKSTP